MITVSVLVPAYNEEATILEILGRVARQNIDGICFEVLVVDDGSRDRTVALLEENPGLYTKLIKRGFNGGKGAAVRAGLKAASGDYVLFQDADLEYDPADYGNLLRPVLEFDADIVMGSRLVAAPITRVSYFWHKVGNRLITFIFNILNNTTFTDIYSCYLLYRRELVNVDMLAADGWEQQAEILSKAVAKAQKMYEVPIRYYGRTYAEGKKIKAHHAVAVLWTIAWRRIVR
ncbi:MAG: glycosyltransferase family 2 protein [Rhodospirillales bacterium]|nr:glycosyltransferase family 2 protein [Rhodospirillales bacterium]MBI2979184.1 glycosyltransferase family 2 protein [Rhodospirillales bacterium]